MSVVIGGGGKTTLVRRLAEELSAHARVIVATSTKMRVPDWCPVLLDASADEVEAALSDYAVVCVGTLFGQTGKLDAPGLGFSDLVGLADYVLVEADGSRGLPLKAHASHEPVIPACANWVVCVLGVDGIGCAISEACHRPELYAQLAQASPADGVTPCRAARVLRSEALHDMVLINKVETDEEWCKAEQVARELEGPVIAGSLREGAYRCLR